MIFFGVIMKSGVPNMRQYYSGINSKMDLSRTATLLAYDVTHSFHIATLIFKTFLKDPKEHMIDSRFELFILFATELKKILSGKNTPIYRTLGKHCYLG